MKFSRLFFVIGCAVVLALPLRGQTVAEYNSGNTWVHPNAQKQTGMDFINTSSGKLMNNGQLWYMGNFINDGIVDYDNTLAITPGLTRFEGLGLQQISGTGTTRFYSLLFNNKASGGVVNLKQNISVAHQLNMTKGVLTASQATPETMTNLVTMEPGSSCINTSNSSFVDGFVVKTGNEVFTFPVGNNGYYRPVSISAPSLSSDQFAARYVAVDPATAGYSRDKKVGTIGSVSRKEYWVVNRLLGTSTPQITLSWDMNTTSDVIPADLTKLMIVRWNGTQWIKEGNAATTGSATSGTITSAVTGYGIFTLGSEENALTAVADSYTISQNSMLQGDVSKNDITTAGITTTWAVTKNPALGSVTMQTDGSFVYTPSGNNTGSDSFTYSVTDAYGATSSTTVTITINPLAGYMTFTKQATKPELQSDASFVWKYIITVANKQAVNIDQVQITDDLNKVFASPTTFTVTGIRTTGNLKANGLYDGSVRTLALLSGSYVASNSQDTLEITVKVTPNGFKGVVSNQAIFSGVSTAMGTSTTTLSDDVSNTTATQPRPTLTTIPEVDIVIPQMFSPNNDGQNDSFVIVHKKDVKVSLEVFSRWGSPVYKSEDYQNDWTGKGESALLGANLPEGTYYYIVVKTNLTTGEKEQYTGFVTIKR